MYTRNTRNPISAAYNQGYHDQHFAESGYKKSFDSSLEPSSDHHQVKNVVKGAAIGAGIGTAVMITKNIAMDYAASTGAKDVREFRKKSPVSGLILGLSLLPEIVSMKVLQFSKKIAGKPIDREGMTVALIALGVPTIALASVIGAIVAYKKEIEADKKTESAHEDRVKAHNSSNAKNIAGGVVAGAGLGAVAGAVGGYKAGEMAKRALYQLHMENSGIYQIIPANKAKTAKELITAFLHGVSTKTELISDLKKLGLAGAVVGAIMGGLLMHEEAPRDDSRKIQESDKKEDKKGLSTGAKVAAGALGMAGAAGLGYMAYKHHQGSAILQAQLQAEFNRLKAHVKHTANSPEHIPAIIAFREHPYNIGKEKVSYETLLTGDRKLISEELMYASEKSKKSVSKEDLARADSALKNYYHSSSKDGVNPVKFPLSELNIIRKSNGFPPIKESIRKHEEAPRDDSRKVEAKFSDKLVELEIALEKAIEVHQKSYGGAQYRERAAKKAREEAEEAIKDLWKLRASKLAANPNANIPISTQVSREVAGKHFDMKQAEKERRRYPESIRKTTEIQDHQQRVVDKLNKSGAVLAFHSMGSGKQHPIDTNVLTPFGWKSIGSVVVGDSVIGSSGKPIKVTGVFPQGIKPSYRVGFSDQSSVEAGPEHLWTMNYLCGGSHLIPLVLTTDQLRLRPVVDSGGKRKFKTDLSKTVLKLPILSGPVEFIQKELPVDPYLLGQLISDGSMCGCSATITMNLDDKDEIIDRILSSGTEISRIDECCGHCVRICVSNMMPRMRSLGLAVKSAQKRIPMEYLQASPEQRISLLHGLMDGDGTCSATNNRLSYSTMSKGLANDVVELVQCLGGIASINTCDRREKGLEYHVRIRVPSSIKPFHISRKLSKYNPGRLALPVRTLSSVEYVRDVESVCIRVDAEDRLYVTENAILTHNSLTGILSSQGDRADVIVPASLRNNYLKEIDKHTHGPGHEVNLMSYEAALKNSGATSKTLIMDEPQAIGHAETDRSKILTKRGKEYDRKLLMTGTPIRNHPSELAPLINLLKGHEALPMDKKAFEDRYIKEVTKEPGLIGKIVGRQPQLLGYDIKNRRELEGILRGHVDYHMPEQTNFPSKSEEVITIQMSPQQQKMYDFALSKLANPLLAYKIKRGLPPSKAESKQLNAFMAATRQISNTTGSYHGSGEASSPKIDLAVEELKKRHEADPNFRGMVYSNYLDSGIKTYQRKLDAHGISNAIFDGTLSDKQREKVVSDYNQGKTKALLVSGAGAQGLDLKGTKLVQILEPHWNTARTEQAKARAIRFMSHDHLPEDERHVHVQTFHSTLRPSFLKSASKVADVIKHPVEHIMDKVQGRERPKDMSADQYLDKMNKDKDALNGKFLDVLKKVGSEHENEKKESLVNIYESAQSAYDERSEVHQSKNKSLSTDIQAQRIRNGILGLALGGSVGAMYGYKYGPGVGSLANFAVDKLKGIKKPEFKVTRTGKSALIGAAIFGGLTARDLHNANIDPIIKKKLNQIKENDSIHVDLTEIHKMLKETLGREPSHEEIDHAWALWEKQKVEDKIARQKEREDAKSRKRINKLMADRD